MTSQLNEKLEQEQAAARADSVRVYMYYKYYAYNNNELMQTLRKQLQQNELIRHSSVSSRESADPVCILK